MRRNFEFGGIVIGGGVTALLLVAVYWTRNRRCVSSQRDAVATIMQRDELDEDDLGDARDILNEMPKRDKFFRNRAIEASVNENLALMNRRPGLVVRGTKK